MYLVVAIIILSSLAFYTKSDWMAANFRQLELLLIFTCGWNWLKNNSTRGKSVFAVSLLLSLYIFLTDWAIPHVPTWYFVTIYATYLAIATFEWFKNYDIKDDKLDRKYVCYLFRKPKDLLEVIRSLFGSATCSFGMLIGELYQARRKHKTIQRIRVTDGYLKDNYYIFNTGFLVSKIEDKWITNLLKQEQRTLSSLWLRLNCLISFKQILCKVNYGNYNGERSPSKFLGKVIKWQKRQ